MKSFIDIFNDCTSQGTKIKTDEYMENGKYAIIDQGQNDIAGYTDLEEGVFENVPAIIFGDHTRVIKYINTPFYLGADGVKLLKAKDANANYKYLYYALRNAKIPNTGYNRHFKWLKEIDIEYPDMEKQNQVVKTLEKLESIIKDRKGQIELFDTLIKARFVEMFGDPVLNEKAWNNDIMKNVCSKITDGEHGSVPRFESGHPFLNAKHIKKDGAIDWDSITYTSTEYYEKIYKRCNPEPLDILMTTTGTIGNVAVVPETARFSMDRGITLLKLNKDLVTPIFMVWLLRFDTMQNIMNANVHASAIGHLFLNKVEKLPVILPDISLQKQFEEFVRQVDKSKVVVQKSLDEAQKLFDALMQEYFS